MPSKARNLAFGLALGGALALHIAALWYTEEIAPGLADTAAIADAGFLLLPEKARGYGEFIPYALLAAILVIRRSALWHFALQAAGLMAARAICVAATVLPPTFEGCRAAPFTAVLHGGCRDKVFSGHVAYTTLMAFHLYEGSRALTPGIVLAGAVLAEAVYLVAAREHYSVDVLVALLLAVLTYRAYPREARGESARLPS